MLMDTIIFYSFTDQETVVDGNLKSDRDQIASKWKSKTPRNN